MADEPDYGVDCVDTAHTGFYVGGISGELAGAAIATEALIESGKAETQSPWTTANEVGTAAQWGGLGGGAAGAALGYGGCEAVEWGKEQLHDLNNYFNPPHDDTSPPAHSDGLGWNAPAFMESTYADASVSGSWLDASPTVSMAPAFEVASAEPTHVSTPSIFDTVHSVFDSVPSSWDSGSSSHDSGWGGHDHGSHDHGSHSGSHDSGTGMGDHGSI